MCRQTDRTRGEVNIMRELSFAELDTERTELLPTRETLTFGNINWANIVATNSSMALNAASCSPSRTAPPSRRSSSTRADDLAWPPCGGEATQVTSSDPDQHERR